MKHLIIFLAINLLFGLLLHNPAQAQKAFKHISLREDGSYILFWGKNGASRRNIPQDLSDKISELNGQGHTLKNVALNNNGDYVLLYGKNGASWQGIPNSLSDKLKELNNQGHTLKSVALNDYDAYVLLWGSNGYWHSGISNSLANKLKELNSQGEILKSIALRNDGTYVLLYDHNSYYYSLYPDKDKNLIEKLQQVTKAGHRLKSVALRDDGTYVILYGNGGYWYSLYTDSKDKSLVDVLKGKKDRPKPIPTSSNTIHFLLFTDTDDSRVGSAAEQTNRYFQNTFVSKLQRHTDMRVKTYYGSGTNFTLANLNSAIANLRTGSNDVIFFYYAGHGYNRGYSNFPTVTLGRSGEPISSRRKNLIDIYNTLKGKNHRLLVVMGEACNKIYASRNNFRSGRLAVNFDPYEDEGRHFRELFVDARGDYLMSSSQRDQLSHLATGQPGYFTCAFRDAFAYYVDRQYNYTATWEKVFNKTRTFTTNNAEEIGETQVPQWCSGYCE